MKNYDVYQMKKERLDTNFYCILGIVAIAVVDVLSLMYIVWVVWNFSNGDGKVSYNAGMIALLLVVWLCASINIIGLIKEEIKFKTVYSDDRLNKIVTAESVEVSKSSLLPNKKIGINSVDVDKDACDCIVKFSYDDVIYKQRFGIGKFNELFSGYDLNSAVKCNYKFKSDIQFVELRVLCINTIQSYQFIRINRVNDEFIQKEEMQAIKEKYAAIIKAAREHYLREYHIDGEEIHSEIMNDLIRENIVKFEELKLDLAYWLFKGDKRGRKR